MFGISEQVVETIAAHVAATNALADAINRLAEATEETNRLGASA